MHLQTRDGHACSGQQLRLMHDLASWTRTYSSTRTEVSWPHVGSVLGILSSIASCASSSIVSSRPMLSGGSASLSTSGLGGTCILLQHPQIMLVHVHSATILQSIRSILRHRHPHDALSRHDCVPVSHQHSGGPGQAAIQTV